MIIVGTLRQTQARRRSGITLTEILIAIMILGVGLVSLATLFPIGLLRIRDANRYTRSAILLQSAAADATSRGLLNGKSFAFADLLNLQVQQPPWNLALPFWYATPTFPTPNGYNPLVEDTRSYGGESHTIDNLGNITVIGASAAGNTLRPFSGPGLPFAYDPLWRYRTGVYLDPIGKSMPEARFGAGIGFIRNDLGVPSAHGLPRLTNFNLPYPVDANGNRILTSPIMPLADNIPGIFVSQEDVVWVEGVPSNPTSPVLPDLSLSSSLGTPALDWRYSWSFTGQQTSLSNASSFDGNIVIWENRPFGIVQPATAPFQLPNQFTAQQVAGETVVEGVFGYSGKVNFASIGGYTYPDGYASGADRTVLLRWHTSQPDPVVRAGDWIADVTYERGMNNVYTRFLNYGPPTGPFGGVPNASNNYEWDNLPPQRCFWYQVQRVTAAAVDLQVGNHRSMTVTVNQPLQARTLLDGNGNPVVLNAALIAPNVVNVIPQTIFSR